MTTKTFFKISTFLFIIFFVFSCSNKENKPLCPKTDPQNPDITWAKRINFKFDFNDKKEQIYNIKMLGDGMMDIILNAAQKGEIKVFDYYEKTPMSQKDVDNIFMAIDTVSVFDVHGAEQVKVVKNPLNRPAVKKFRINQEWYFDQKAFKLTSRVLGIAPLEEIYNEDGSFRGDKPLFWVLFEE